MINFTTLRGAQAMAIAFGAVVLAGGPAAADQVIADDLIVQGSICTGLDCVNNESFGFTTIRLKENNTRIDFTDTSAAPFPARDWRLEANSSASGGANYFAIKDMGDSATGDEGGTALFTVTAGAPANSLFVDSTGRLGIKTSTPVLDIHDRSGNTPGVRLEQDGSSGFAPQTWDVAGNEANFFVRDVTGGSRLPLRIRPGAPTSSIDIASSGFVGIGTASPAARLHVVGSGDTSFRMDSGTNIGWLLTSKANGDLSLKNMVDSALPFQVLSGAPTNSLAVRANGTVRMAAYPNCNSLQTNVNGIIICAAASPTAPGVAGQSSASGISAYLPRSGGWASLGQPFGAQSGTGSAGSGSGSGAAEDPSAHNTCGAGDLTGAWTLIGANIEKFGTDSVLWCDVELAQDRPASSYRIGGNCRSHAPNGVTPEEFTIVGGGTITESASCGLSGSFQIKHGEVVETTVSLLEGRIEGPASKKMRAVAVSRLRRGRASAIQTFVMQR